MWGGLGDIFPFSLFLLYFVDTAIRMVRLKSIFLSLLSLRTRKVGEVWCEGGLYGLTGEWALGKNGIWLEGT